MILLHAISGVSMKMVHVYTCTYMHVHVNARVEGSKNA